MKINFFDGECKISLGVTPVILKTDAGKDSTLTLVSKSFSLGSSRSCKLQVLLAQKWISINHDDQKIVPIIIHGDALFAGQVFV